MASRTVGEIELEESDTDVTLDDEGDGEFELWFSGDAITAKVDLTRKDLEALRNLLDKALN